MARRDPVGIRLLTRRGNDWADRFPLVVEAVNHLKVRSCLIDGEVVCCDARGLATFQLLRQRRNEATAFLYAFDLLELDGTDMRREPIEGSQGDAGQILRKSRPGVRLNEHLEHPAGAVVFQHACKMGLEGIVSKRPGITRPIGPVARLAQVRESRGSRAMWEDWGRSRVTRSAQFELSVDGVPRSYRDRKDLALQSAQILKSRNPNSVVRLKDLQTGKDIVIAFQSGQ